MTPSGHHRAWPSGQVGKVPKKGYPYGAEGTVPGLADVVFAAELAASAGAFRSRGVSKKRPMWRSPAGLPDC
jgi:hypothetical protein